MILPHQLDALNLHGDSIQEALDAKDRLQHSTAMERDALARRLHAVLKERIPYNPYIVRVLLNEIRDVTYDRGEVLVKLDELAQLLGIKART